jgi:hypothetical protein
VAGTGDALRTGAESRGTTGADDWGVTAGPDVAFSAGFSTTGAGAAVFVAFETGIGRSLRMLFAPVGAGAAGVTATSFGFCVETAGGSTIGVTVGVATGGGVTRTV